MSTLALFSPSNGPVSEKPCTLYITVHGVTASVILNKQNHHLWHGLWIASGNLLHSELETCHRNSEISHRKFRFSFSVAMLVTTRGYHMISSCQKTLTNTKERILKCLAIRVGGRLRELHPVAEMIRGAPFKDTSEMFR